MALAEAVPAAEVAAEVERMGGEAPFASGVAKSQAEKSARVYLALRAFAAERGYDALALSCWSRFQAIYGIAVCAAMSRLNEGGTVDPLRSRRDQRRNDARPQCDERRESGPAATSWPSTRPIAA